MCVICLTFKNPYYIKLLPGQHNSQTCVTSIIPKAKLLECMAQGRPISQANMVCSSAVHVCWEKLFNYFDIEPRYVNLAEGCFVARPEKVLCLCGIGGNRRLQVEQKPAERQLSCSAQNISICQLATEHGSSGLQKLPR